MQFYKYVQMSKGLFRDLYKPYWFLVIFRLILVLMPQRGYIHPDEYFQSVEVLAGNFFNVQSNVPWEFNVTFPVRSVATIYATVGISFKLLQIINNFLSYWFDITIVTTYFLLIFPRIIVCMLSYIVDFSIYKISTTNGEVYKSRLIILATSYVLIVYGTRTFSNTIELILFAMLLCYVCESVHFSNIIIKEQEYLNDRYQKCKTPVERAQIQKMRKYLPAHSFKNCCIISTITVIGFFNRPTFLAFAISPVFFWLHRGLGCKSVASINFYFRTLGFIFCTIPTTACLILIDSFYYGYVSMAEIQATKTVSMSNFIVTPLNFIKYNLNTKNLAEHGLHKRYLHLLVNVPLLFNVLGLLAVLNVLFTIYRVVKNKCHHLPTVRSITGLMVASTIIPIAILSIFPHQEPRFLIPTLIPLVYLYAPVILSEYNWDNNSAVKNTNQELQLRRKTAYFHKYSLLKCWFFFNAMFVIFYGFIHQGGIFQLTTYLSKELQYNTHFDNVHVFTSYIYSIPESLLLQKSTSKIYYTNNTAYIKKKRLFLYEEGSNNFDIVLSKISHTLKANENAKNKKPEVYIVFPDTVFLHLQLSVKKSEFSHLKLIHVKTFYPHLSTEALPDLNIYCLKFFPTPGCEIHLSTLDYIQNYFSLLRLRLFEVCM